MAEPVIRSAFMRFVVYGHVALAAGAAVQVRWMSAVWFDGGDWRRDLAVGLATFGGYGFLRLIRSRDVGLHDVPHFAWYRRNGRWMAAAIIISLVLVALLLVDSLRDLLALWPAVLVAALYVTPFKTKAGLPLGLRQVPVLKSFVIAWAWAFVLVKVAAIGDSGSRSMALPLIIVQSAFILALTIPFDIRDLPFDPPALKTIPQLIGSRASRWLSLALLFPLFALLYTSHALSSMASDGGIDWSYLLPLIGLVVPASLILRSAPERGWLHWLLLDACIALIPLLAMVGSAI